MSRIYGGPIEHGTDLHGRRVVEKRGRPKGLLDELRELQQRENILPDNSRDPDAPNFAEQREAADLVDRYVDDLAHDPSVSGGKPAREFNDDGTADDLLGTPAPGLSVGQQAELRRRLESEMAGMTRKDFKAARKSAFEADTVNVTAQEITDDVWRRFQAYAPQLAKLPPGAIEDAVVKLSGLYDLADEEDRQSFVEHIAEMLMQTPLENFKPHVEQTQQTEHGSGIADLIRERQKKEGWN